VQLPPDDEEMQDAPASGIALGPAAIADAPAEPSVENSPAASAPAEPPAPEPPAPEAATRHEPATLGADSPPSV
jgi:hypothetical protein